MKPYINIFAVNIILSVVLGCDKTDAETEALNYVKAYSMIIDSIDFRIETIGSSFDLIDETQDSMSIIQSFEEIDAFEKSLIRWMNFTKKRNGFRGDSFVDQKTLEFFETVRFELIPSFHDYTKGQKNEILVLKAKGDDVLLRQIELREELIIGLSEHIKKTEKYSALLQAWVASFDPCPFRYRTSSG